MDRLGAGEDGEWNDFTALKQHKFFENINFKNLKSVPNYDSIITKLKLKQEAEESNKLLEEKKREEEKLKKRVVVIKEDIVEKKSPWLHYNTRKLILYSNGKVEYIDPESNIVKGVIDLSDQCKASFLSNSKFNLVTPKREYIFKVNSNFKQTIEYEAGVWTREINDLIQKLF